MATEDYMAGTYSKLVEVTEQKAQPETHRKAAKVAPVDRPIAAAASSTTLPPPRSQPVQQPQQPATIQVLGNWTLDLNDPTGIPRTFPFSSQDVEALNDLKTLMRRH